jgi:hypothetical protein
MTTTVQEPINETGIQSGDEHEVEEPTRGELDTILDGLVQGDQVEPTLVRSTEEDVALDMDELEVDVEDASDGSDWDTEASDESDEEM